MPRSNRPSSSHGSNGESVVPAALTRAAFEAEDWRAVYVAGSLDLYPRRFGDNYGCYPITVGIVRAQRDNIGSRLDDASPAFAMGLICRMWCVGLDYAKALESIVKMRIDGVTVPMRKSWKALDGTVNLMDFREDLYRFLDDSGFEFWPEEDFKEELERRARLMMAEKAQTPSERRSRFRILE